MHLQVHENTQHETGAIIDPSSVMINIQSCLHLFPILTNIPSYSTEVEVKNLQSKKVSFKYVVQERSVLGKI